MALGRATAAAKGVLRSPALLGAAIFLLAAMVFLPTLQHEWLNYDDDLYITENHSIALGFGADGFAWAFSTFYGGNWFPLTWLSWMLDYTLFGWSAPAFHATGILLHAGSSLLLFLALARMTGAPGRSAFVAAVFAIHPLHVESVAWAAARKDTLSGLLWMLALLTHARGDDSVRRGARRRLALWVCMVCAVMAKPTALTLPFALLFLDAWPLLRFHGPDTGARLRQAIAEKAELFVTLGVMSAVVLAAQRSVGAVAPLDLLSVGARIGNALVAWASYLGMAVWPSGLAVLYPHPGSARPLWQPLLSALLLAALTAGAWWALRPGVRGRTRPYLAMGWIWYLATLLPVIGLVQVGSQAMADRYMYLPLIGLAIAAAWGVEDLLRERPATALTAALAAIAALSFSTHRQLHHWQNSEALFEHTLRVTRNNPIAHAHLGAALLARGAIEETVEHYSESLRLRPDSADVANNLAWLLATEPGHRNPYLAIRLAERAAGLTLRQKPHVLDTLAAAYASDDRFSAAEAAALEAASLARSQGLTELAEEIDARRDLYRLGKTVSE